MNVKEIKELLDLMGEHQIVSLEFEKGDVKIKLSKSSGSNYIASGPTPQPAISMPIMSAAPAAAAATPAPVAVNDPNVVVIKSPMVGTYYSAPAPDQPAYAKVGQPIKEGDVLCIVEAMKLMNEIKAEMSGTVVEILIENGQPIEYDQPILKIKKN